MRSILPRRLKSRVLVIACALAVPLAVLPLLAIVWTVAVRGAAALDANLFTQPPVPLGAAGGGLLHALSGSGLLAGFGLLMALPFALLTGLYLAEYGDNAFGEALRAVIDLMGGLPAIVIGILAYASLVQPTRHFSAWSGAAALGLMALPLIARRAERVLRQVPRHLREAGFALGLPQWQVLQRIVWPVARAGLAAGILTALARIAGEAAPLLLTAFGNPDFNLQLNRPMAALPTAIYRDALTGSGGGHPLSWGAALILCAGVFALNLAARARMRPRT
ncbi:MAG TPA: phosphate ABC transporter permease PstA [Limnochordia bacterium]|nr:phosphate ABC transporter permease PstA [Limnochordia bacterium]